MNADSFRAIVPDTSPEILSWRMAAGKDVRDEVWDGVYHVIQDKSRRQVDLENELEDWLTIEWSGRTGGRVFRDTRLAKNRFWELDGQQADFRVPSLCLYRTLPPHSYVNQVLISPPDVVVEVFDDPVDITSKADYYRTLGVSEVWGVDAMTFVCELIHCESRRWISTISNHQHPIYSPVTGVQIETAEEEDKKGLRLRWATDDLSGQSKSGSLCSGPSEKNDNLVCRAK